MENRPGSLRDDIVAQTEFVRTRSPAYARLLELIEAMLDAGLERRLEEAWRGRTFGAFYERPLILLGALRYDALRQGESHPLWRGIAAPDPDPSSITQAAVERALAPDQAELWSTISTRYLQTNEPSRAVAWLWPARLAAESGNQRPLALFDIGASAGLNLVADRLERIWERDDGEPLEVAPLVDIVRRDGFDIRPLDVTDESDARWLLACVWPGQSAREARLRESITQFRRLSAGPNPPTVHAASAGEVPARLPRGEDGLLAVAYQTVFRDYLPDAERTSYEAGMLNWLQSRPTGSAVWVELEVTSAVRSGGPPAALTVHVLAAGTPTSIELAHCEPHPRRLEVHDDAVARFQDSIRR